MQLILLSQLLLGRNSAGVCLKCRFGRNLIKLRQRQQPHNNPPSRWNFRAETTVLVSH
jgi:hypothetical protein